MGMKRNIVLAACILAASQANALVVVDQIGDADGFGIGAQAGETFDWTAIGSGDGDGTDVWFWGDQTFTHTYDLTGLGAITSATLEVFTGGQGWTGESSVFIDGSLVGQLTIGDGPNTARLDSFDLMAFASDLDGASTLTIDTTSTGDGWVLDYSRLTISDEGVAVSEPATIAMLGLGLAGIGFSRRKSKA